MQIGGACRRKPLAALLILSVAKPWQHRGYGWKIRIERVRLDRVRGLLARTDLPIKQIAHRVGYRYPEYLMRVFKAATGQTLKQYRESFGISDPRFAGNQEDGEDV